MTVLRDLIEPVTAGDPMSERKWVRSSLRELSRRLGEAGHPASPPTVRRLLDTLGYRLDKVALLTGLDPRHFDDAVQIRLSLLLRALQGRLA